MSKTKHNLKIKDKNGALYTVPLYTSTSDLRGGQGQQITVDKQKLYFPIGSTSDPERTPMRIKKSNGTTYAVLKTGTPPYKQELFVNKNSDKTKDYTGTFTVPAGVTRIRVALCTGGANYEKIKTPDNDGSLVEELVHIVGRDTSFGEISATNKKQKEYWWGCKPSFTFSDLNGHYARERMIYDYWQNPPKKSEYYGFPRYGGEGARGYYYSGYITVKPNQKINYKIGGIDYLKRDSMPGLFEWNCGFILIAYGIGIEK